MANQIKQGNDVLVTLQLMKSGANVDFAGKQSIRAVLFVGGVEQKTYSLVQNSGEGKLVVDGTDSTKLNIYVERIESKNFQVGAAKWTILYSVLDANFPDGEFTDTGEIFNWSVIKGDALNTPMP